MWSDFNVCWLALLQRQKEVTEQAISLDRSTASSENLVSAGFLDRMGSELVRLCDSIERHGLVDYEMGVAEEEIMNGRSHLFMSSPVELEGGFQLPANSYSSHRMPGPFTG